MLNVPISCQVHRRAEVIRDRIRIGKVSHRQSVGTVRTAQSRLTSLFSSLVSFLSFPSRKSLLTFLYVSVDQFSPSLSNEKRELEIVRSEFHTVSVSGSCNAHRLQGFFFFAALT